MKLDRSPGPGYKTETEVRSQDLGQANGQNMGTSDDPKTLAVVQNSPDAGPLVQFITTCNNDGRTKWSQMVGNSHSARDILWHPYGNGIHQLQLLYAAEQERDCMLAKSDEMTKQLIK